MILFPGQGVRIEVDDPEFDFAEVDDVIEAHDKTKKSKLAKDREEKEAKKQAVLDQLGITKKQLEDLLGG
jgi:ribosomal protein L21